MERFKSETLFIFIMSFCLVVVLWMGTFSVSSNTNQSHQIITKTVTVRVTNPPTQEPNINVSDLRMGVPRAQTLVEWSVHPKKFCFGNLSSDIALASLGDITDAVLPDLPQLSRLNKGHYAMKYNYAYCEFTANTEIGRNPVYSKAAILLNVLKLYKYAIWIDFDVIAHPNSRSFDHLLNIFERNSSINAVLTSDSDGETGTVYPGRRLNISEDGIRQPPESNPPYYRGVNTGIHMYRSCNWTFNFIEEWHSYFKKADDQQSIFWHSYEHWEEWNRHIKIVKCTEIELIGKNDAQHINAQHDDHLLHLAGGKWTWEKKQHIMKRLIVKHMDEGILKEYEECKASLTV